MKKTLFVLIAICVCIAFSSCQKECIHDFDSAITAEANCLKEGVKTDTCKLCGYSCTEPIPTTDHDYDAGVVTVEANCTAEGTRTYTCSVCADTKTEPIPMVEHEFSEGVETKAPTCTEKGVLTYTCKGCGDTKDEELDTLEHVFGEKTVTGEPTCVAEGEISVFCTLCNHQEQVEKIPKSDKHDYTDKVIRKPTCTDRGKGEKVCTLCGHSVECDYDLANHSYGDAECNTYAKCTVCGSKSPEKAGHDYVVVEDYKPTDHFAGQKVSKCSYCGKTETKLYGKNGKYDLDAAKNVGLKHAKELGFGMGTVTTESNDGRDQNISTYFFSVEYEGGQKALEKIVIRAVDRLYNGYGSSSSKYNIKITVSYYTSGALGTGYFVVTATAHYK